MEVRNEEYKKLVDYEQELISAIDNLIKQYESQRAASTA